MARRLPAPTPDRYETVDQLAESLSRKGTPQPGDGLYPRDGMQEVTDIEEALSELTISGQERNVVVPSGMAAVHGATEFAMQTKGLEGRHKGNPGFRPRLAYPPYLYGQSVRGFQGLEHMGVLTVKFEPGDPDAVDALFEGDKKADVIFAETVSNTPDMPVLNVPHLLDRLRAEGDDGPILVLDNTLPLSTGINFEEHLEDTDRVLVVESATKSAMHNSEHLGVAYSAHEELIDGFRKHKITHGLVTSVNANQSILRSLEATSPRFHERNKALYANTGVLATYVAAAQAAHDILGDSPDDFTVAFPERPEHPNHDYAAEHLTDGVAPVVFIDHPKYTDGAAEDFLRKLTDHPDVRAQIDDGQVFMGQSFGFREARILYDPNASQLRLAGGYKIDARALGRALFNALLEIE